MTDPRRAAVRDFLQTALTAEPRAADYAALALPERAEGALRGAVRAVRKTARSGGWNGEAARAVIDDLTPDLLAAIPDDWEPKAEDPEQLASKIAPGGRS